MFNLPIVRTGARLSLFCLILTLFSAFASRDSAAQSTLFDDVPAMYEAVFSELNDSFLSTGILAERAYPVFPFHTRFGDLPYHDSLATTPSSFPWAVGMIQHMTTDSVAHLSHWLRNDFYDRLAPSGTSSILHLTAIALQFDRFRDSAEHHGLIMADTSAKRIYDVLPRPSSPYRLDTALIFSSLSAKLSSGPITISLDSFDLMSNFGPADQLEIDLGTGFQSIKANMPFTYTFPASDTFALTLRAIYGTDTLLAHSTVEVVAPQRSARMTDPRVAIEGGGGDLIYYTNESCDRGSRNLIIFVGGYDPNNERSGRQVTLEKLDEYVVDDDNSPYNGLNISEIIDDANLDIVFVDWADGGARMQDNGEVVARAIKQINRFKAEKGITAPSVIVGQSMGGLCTKIGLSLLEDENYEHNISKYFSWDTPHRGANVPINLQAALTYGMQVAASYNQHRSEEYSRAYQAQFSSASRQLKFHHVWASNRPAVLKKEIEYSSQVFNTFQDYYRALDIDVPHYAMSNGSGTDDQERVVGTVTVAPGSHIFRADATGIGAVAGLGAFVDITVRCFFLPGNFTSRGFIVIGIPYLEFPIPMLFHNNFDAQVTNYDIVPASISDVGLSEVNNMSDTPFGFGTNALFSHGYLGNYDLDIYTRYFAYVPTFSSQQLDEDLIAPIGQGGGDITAAVVSRSESWPNPIEGAPGPTSVWNHEHVSFTPQIANFFITNAIENQPVTFLGINDQSDIDIKYNYGRGADGASAPKLLGGVRSVLPSASIYINRDFRIRDISNTSNSNAISGQFELDLSDGTCYPIADITLQPGSDFIVGENQYRKGVVTGLEGTRVTIKSGATFEVKDRSELRVLSVGAASEDNPLNNGGIVVESGGVLHARSPHGANEVGGRIIADGGTIRIKAGGQLRTSYNAQIIARNGGKIILEDGALVQLWAGSDPEGEGTVWIQEGGELVIEGEYVYSGSGYWQFDQGNTVSGDGDFVIEGDGMDYRRMKVNSGAKVLLDDGQDFLIKNAKVNYGADSDVTVVDGSKFEILNVKLEGPAFPAILTDGSARSSIDNSEFLNNKSGVILNQKGPLSALYINTSLFQSSTTAGVTFTGWSPDNFGRTPSINGCSFNGCEAGVVVDNFIAANISNSTFTSSEAYQFAIIAQDCQSLFLNNCSVIGYETELGFTSKEGAVELELVTARFSGGEYSANTIAIHDQGGSVLTFEDCVDVIANCYGIANSEIAAAGYMTTLALNGMSLLNNSIGIHGGSGIITSGGINSFQMPEGSSCDFAATPRLIYMDVNQMASPSITLNGNHWMDAQGVTLTTTPDPSDWFCIDNSGGPGCDLFPIPTNNIQLQGCASGPCEDPETCEYYCDLYPESPECYYGGGGGAIFRGFKVTPNPSGGVVDVHQLTEEEGTLYVFDSKGAILKSIQLGASISQSVNLSDLPNGMYTLQLIPYTNSTQEAVRVVIEK